MPTVGPRNVQNPCQNEITGIYYKILQLYSLCNLYNVTEGHINIHCNGLSAVQRLDYYRKGSYISGQNFDIINAIMALWDNIPITIKFNYIKGNQNQGSA